MTTNELNEDYKDFLSDSSRVVADMAVHHVGDNKKMFSDLLELCFEKPYPFNMRASRVVQIYCSNKPEMILPYLEELIPMVLKSDNSGVKRNFLKIFYENVPLDKLPHQAMLLNACFEWLASEKEPIALRYYALKLLYRFGEKEKDIMHEVKLIMDNLDLKSLKGLQSYWKKILKQSGEKKQMKLFGD
ncbi:MAG: hypothetical protein WCH34_17280 [Bacteroidota bacterium]